jgi:hypothetical protein
MNFEIRYAGTLNKAIFEDKVPIRKNKYVYLDFENSLK